MIVYHIPYLDAKDLNQIMLRFSKIERPVKVIRTDTGSQISVIDHNLHAESSWVIRFRFVVLIKFAWNLWTKE